MHQIVNINPIKRALVDWFKVLVLLLDEDGVAVLVILVLQFLKIRFPLSTIIIIALLVGTPVFIIHVAMIPISHRKPVTGRDGRSAY